MDRHPTVLTLMICQTNAQRFGMTPTYLPAPVDIHRVVGVIQAIDIARLWLDLQSKWIWEVPGHVAFLRRESQRSMSADRLRPGRRATSPYEFAQFVHFGF